jgi:hypothetical protein
MDPSAQSAVRSVAAIGLKKELSEGGQRKVSTGRLSRTRRQDDVSYWGGTSKSLTPESAASNSRSGRALCRDCRAWVVIVAVVVRANAHLATVMSRRRRRTRSGGRQRQPEWSTVYPAAIADAHVRLWQIVLQNRRWSRACRLEICTSVDFQLISARPSVPWFLSKPAQHAERAAARPSPAWPGVSGSGQ